MSTRDALDPGPDHTFPWLPRDENGYLDTALMPIGTRWQNGVLIDVEPTVRLANGSLVKVTDVCPPPPGTAT